MISIIDKDAGQLHVVTSIINYNILDRQSGKRCFTASGRRGVIKFNMNPVHGRHYSIYPNTGYFVTEEDVKQDRGI